MKKGCNFAYIRAEMRELQDFKDILQGESTCKQVHLYERRHVHSYL